MKVYSFGAENAPAILLLPGTCCHWRGNFGRVIPLLSDRYRVLCVSYDGFDETEHTEFPTMPEETEKIEAYIQKHCGGHIRAGYGCSLGGSFVGLLAARGNIHMDYGILGSSDLDQASPLAAKLQTNLLLPLIYLLVNVKIAQLGESFPITIVTFLPVLLLLFLERISVKKLMIALGIGAGLTAFNYLFGQSLDASTYVTSTMLFVYIVIIIGMVWSIRFKTISPHNHRKILRFFYLVVGLVVALAAVEMAQIILTGGSSIMESISKYLIYSNSYVLNFIKFGGKRTTALYFEPAFFALALISIWLSIKQFGIKTPKTDAMILAGIILSGSFSGVMTFILFYLLEWAFQYLNKEAIKKKLPLALISLAVFLVGVVIAFPYISTRLGDLGTEGSSSYYRIVGPLVMVGYSLTHIDGVVRFGSLYEYVASFGIFNGADVGKTIDNGLYLLIIYFSWFAVFLSLWYMGKVIKMMINAFGDNRNFRVQLYLFTPVSLFFTGSIFSPEYAFLIVCPFILRKALNITR